MLDNLYSLQVLHNNEEGVVLGNPNQDSQREITLRESRMRFHLLIVSRYLLPLLVSNCKLEISTVLPLCPK